MSNSTQQIALERLVEDSPARRNFDTIEAEWDAGPAQARVYNDASQAIGTGGSGTALTFNKERYDTGNFHSTSSNTSRLTAPTAGLYLIGGSLGFAANSTGRRQAFLRVNGSTDISYFDPNSAPSATAPWLANLNTQYQLAKGDYVELFVFQTSGGNLNVTSNANYSPEFWIVRLGSQA